MRETPMVSIFYVAFGFWGAAGLRPVLAFHKFGIVSTF